MHSKPKVVLATTPSCPHCPTMKRLLSELAERGFFAEFQIVDISQTPELAEQYQIRSVPWLKMGELEFNGVYTLAELEQWTQVANSEDGIRQYLSKEFEQGRLADVERLIAHHPEWLSIAISLLADMQAPMQARIGLSALIEGLDDQKVLQTILPVLKQYSEHHDQRVRADACHLLANIDSEEAKQALRVCLNDSVAEVREIAKESLELFE